MDDIKVKEMPMAMGRPRAFDTDEALDRALEVFWRKGYAGASLSDLTEAMGINPPSLYAAFGNKEALFRKALDRYEQGPARYISEALEAPTARVVFERLLRGAADLQTGARNPKGCLIVQGALACSETANPIREELMARRASGLAAIRQRFKRAKAEGELPAGVDPSDLARYVATVVEGMAVQAASGAGRRDLQRVVDVALRAWPEKSRV
jgi:AcrR family transcriptional regulator